jgi:general secretion pathway protein J
MKSNAGFTLLELLVALVVLGLVMVGLVQGVRFGIAGWESQARQIDATAELDGVDRVLRELFHGIAVSGAVSFEGGPDRVSFTGLLPGAVPAPFRLADMTLLVTPDHRLVLRWQPHRHAHDLTAPPTIETELARRIGGVAFSYWPASARIGDGWQSNLSGMVPSLIRIRIIALSGDRRHWPDLIAAPVATPG